MSHVNTVFGQLLQLLPRHDFEKHVKQYETDRYVKDFTCWKQLITMLYAQIKGRDSLRDIVTGLSAQSDKWYHIGLTSVARSTLADANNKRDWHIYEGLFYSLLQRCRNMTPKHKFKFKNPLYSLDSTVVSLCLSLFPWAKYRTTKGALKIHFLLDHRGCIPSFAVVTEGRRHDVAVAKEVDLPLEPDSIIALDRAYLDLKYLHSLHEKGYYFVTRAKKNTLCEITGQQKMPDKKGLLGDLVVRLGGYPEDLRLVVWWDEDTDREFAFLTNNFKLAASTIAAVYKARWQIELFFKWIKQNLKIKSFLGTSENAVMTQIWVAMCYYLLLAYVQYQSRYKHGVLALARIFRETLMDRVSLVDIFSLNPNVAVRKIRNARAPSAQLAFF
jgi:hypothetical protein